VLCARGGEYNREPTAVETTKLARVISTDQKRPNPAAAVVFVRRLGTRRQQWSPLVLNRRYHYDCGATAFVHTRACIYIYTCISLKRGNVAKNRKDVGSSHLITISYVFSCPHFYKTRTFYIYPFREMMWLLTCRISGAAPSLVRFIDCRPTASTYMSLYIRAYFFHVSTHPLFAWIKRRAYSIVSDDRSHCRWLIPRTVLLQLYNTSIGAKTKRFGLNVTINNYNKILSSKRIPVTTRGILTYREISPSGRRMRIFNL